MNCVTSAQCLIVIVNVFWLPLILSENLGEGPPMDYCPPADPNCHPWCIKYDSNKCRLCMCNPGEKGHTSGSGFASGSAHNTDTDWSSGFGGSSEKGNSQNGEGWAGGSGFSSGSTHNTDTDWSSGFGSSENGNSQNGNSQNGQGWGGGKETSGDEHVKYIIIEKPSESSQSSVVSSPYHSGFGGSSSGFSSFASSPFQTMGRPSPFQGPGGGALGGPQGLGVVPGGRVPDHLPSVPPGHHIENVQMSSQPGVPVSCVTYPILCPVHCVRRDEYGCHSCPCAPASMQLLPVIVPDRETTPAPKKQECVGTLLCMLTCKDGYELGEVQNDGCQKCTCVKKAPPTTPPPKRDCAEKAVKCMLSCSNQHKGYEIKGSDDKGCPKCHCINKNGTESSGNSSNHGQQGNGGGGGGTGSHGTNTWNTGSGGSGSGGSGTNNFLSSPGGGAGAGGCPGPMCPGTSTTGSGHGATNLSEMPKDCNPPMSYANCPGTTGGGGIGTGSGGSSSCAGPFCASGSGSGGGKGTGSGMTGNGGSGSCAGPFCASGGGGGGGGGGGVGGSSGGGGGSSTSGGSAGTGGMTGSPFMAALSGSGAPGMGMPGRGMGASPFGGGGGAGPHGPMTPGSLPTNQDVAAVAGNTDCFGPSCSVKGGKEYHVVNGQECPELLDCPIRCDLVFDNGLSGCPRCTCLDQ